jgi:glucose/mannose-6-phosphate isomerase
VQARYELAPELCHNEVESFKQASFNPPSLKVAVVMLRSEVESRLETTLLEVLKETLEKSGLDALYEVWGEGDTLESILTSVYFIDYLTYYLAILRGVDPSPVASIEAFKGMLKEKM